MQKQTISNTKTSLSNGIKHITLLSMLFSEAIVLSIVESFIPMPALPGVKLGLSNIVVMFTLLSMSKFDALLLVILKGLFAFITRGFAASVMSISGGLCSILVMILLLLLFKNKISLLMLSVSGALFHNIGQVFAASWLSGTLLTTYLPLLLLAGVAAGFITSVVLKILLPVLKKSKLKFTL
ncbi:MAG: Gx transporter family protein [Clostridiales bacterium]|nr:Gx transporter family protein [Clostridiales bacterium]